MKFRVSLTTSAKQNVRGILRWIQERSRSGAEAWYRRWQRVLNDLGQSADTFGAAAEDDDHDETIRQVVFKTHRGLPYRALFVVRGPNVFVLHVRGPGQDLMSPDEIDLLQ
jgi:plasmid stabilization system protein ParE